MSRTPISFNGLLAAMPVFALLALAPPARANLITNGSFESVSPALLTNGICTNDPAIYPYSACSATGWTGKYQIGNGATSGVFGVSFNIPQPDPNGSNALILQTYLNVVSPSATQSISIPTAGRYTLTFDVANRSAPAGNNGPQTVSVLLDNSVLAGGIYGDLPNAWTAETLDFDATAGTHSLTLEGLTTSSGDVSAFVDDVSLVSANVPEPSSLSLIAASFIGLAVAMRVARKRFPV